MQGQYLGNYAPYGYQKSSLDKHKLIIDDITAPIVHFIFEQYAFEKNLILLLQNFLPIKNTHSFTI